MPIRVFRNGTWYEYEPPTSTSSLWNESYKLRAASLYVSAQLKGFTKEESETLAECLIHQDLYPGIRYSKRIQSKLQSLFV